MALVDVIIGYAKGAQGDVGPQGPTGPQGPEGPQGPLPPLVNNALATTAGVAALDAVMGKTLQDQITQTNSNLTGYGENSDGKYWKFPDGTLICASQKTFSNIPITTAWGVLFENASALNLGNFPYPFVSTPISIQATTIGQAVGIERVALTSATAWGNTYFYMPMSVTLQTIIISLVAIGKWKN